MDTYWAPITSTYAGHASVRATPQVDHPFAFPRNAAGFTYGSDLNATSPQNEPDLVLAAGAGDVVGYVRSADLMYGSGVGLTMQQIRALPAAAGRHTIPLYAKDGTTVIGTYDMLPGGNG
jgi:hypothetical protein